MVNRWVVASENTSAFQQKALGFHFHIFIVRDCKQQMMAKNNLKKVDDAKNNLKKGSYPE